MKAKPKHPKHNFTERSNVEMFKYFRKVLTNAEIKALPTTSFELVAAPGSGKVIVPIQAALWLGWTADYANINAQAGLRVGSGPEAMNALLSHLSQEVGSTVSALLAGGGEGVGAFLGPSSRSFIPSAPSFTFPVGLSGFYASDIENKALVLAAVNNGDGDFTGGDDANYLVVEGAYIELDTTSTP